MFLLLVEWVLGRKTACFATNVALLLPQLLIGHLSTLTLVKSTVHEELRVA